MTIEQGIQEIGDLVTPENLQKHQDIIEKKEEPEIEKRDQKPKTLIHRHPGFNKLPRKRREERAS